MEPYYEVVSPFGEQVKLGARGARHLESLNGKTIAELSVGMYNFQASFPFIRQALQARFSSVKVIPYSEFPEILMMTQGEEYQEYVKHIVRLLKDKGCDAVIVGNGG